MADCIKPKGPDGLGLSIRDTKGTKGLSGHPHRVRRGLYRLVPVGSDIWKGVQDSGDLEGGVGFTPRS